MRLGVVDYGVGNLGSVVRALEELKSPPRLISCSTDVSAFDALILPGVGSFRECKEILDADGWTAAIRNAVLGRGVSLLGICLGMQLLATSGTEGAGGGERVAGLDLIPGRVESLIDLGCAASIPHMGWNSVSWNLASPILEDIPNGSDFYFVHSYAFVAENKEHVIATVDHDIEVAAVVGKGRVWGTQFHPEKSSRAGFKILKNFITASRC